MQDQPETIVGDGGITAAVIGGLLAALTAAASVGAAEALASARVSKSRRSQAGSVCNASSLPMTLYQQGQECHGHWVVGAPQEINAMPTPQEGYAAYIAFAPDKPDWAKTITDVNQLDENQASIVVSWLSNTHANGAPEYDFGCTGSFSLDSNGAGVEGLVAYRLQGLVGSSAAGVDIVVVFMLRVQNFSGNIHAGCYVATTSVFEQTIGSDDQKLEKIRKIIQDSPSPNGEGDDYAAADADGDDATLHFTPFPEEGEDRPYLEVKFSASEQTIFDVTWSSDPT